jgi:hypothetical protein
MSGVKHIGPTGMHYIYIYIYIYILNPLHGKEIGAFLKNKTTHNWSIFFVLLVLINYNNEMCLWNTYVPESDKSIDIHAYIKAWKIKQMLSSHCQITCFITVITSIAMERFCHKEISPGKYDWKVIPKVSFQYVGQTSRLRSQSQICWDFMGGSSLM